MFTDISSEMIFGILPVFMIDELGLGKGVFGFIEGLGESVGYGSRTFSGALSDKLGRRKPLVFLGYFLSTVAKPLFAISSVWQHVLAVRVSDRSGKGIRNSPRDALLSDSVNITKVGRAFGIHRSLDSIGAVVGPLIAFLLIPLLGIREIFWISLIPAAVALVIIFFFVTLTIALSIVYVVMPDKRTELRLLRLGDRVARDHIIVLTGLVGDERVLKHPK